MENFLTKEQEVVVNARMEQGYELFGITVSNTNGLDSFVISKGKHLMVINSLGYDEHCQGKTWKLK